MKKKILNYLLLLMAIATSCYMYQSEVYAAGNKLGVLTVTDKVICESTGETYTIQYNNERVWLEDTMEYIYPGTEYYFEDLDWFGVEATTPVVKGTYNGNGKLSITFYYYVTSDEMEAIKEEDVDDSSGGLAPVLTPGPFGYDVHAVNEKGKPLEGLTLYKSYTYMSEADGSWLTYDDALVTDEEGNACLAPRFNVPVKFFEIETVFGYIPTSTVPTSQEDMETAAIYTSITTMGDGNAPLIIDDANGNTIAFISANNYKGKDILRHSEFGLTTDDFNISLYDDNYKISIVSDYEKAAHCTPEFTESAHYAPYDERVYVTIQRIANKNTIVTENGKSYLRDLDGKLINKTGLVNVDGTYYYVVKGVVNKSTTLVKHNGTYYYVSGGTHKKVTTLVKYGNNWWYVKNGILCKDTTLVKYNGTYYYVTGGKKTNATTLVKYSNAWWYVKNGILCKTTTLVNYNGKYYYVANGKMSTATTLVKYGNYYWYVSGGTIKKVTTLVKYGSKYYFVYQGRVNFNYTGTYVYNGVRWKIVKGVVTGRV